MLSSAYIKKTTNYCNYISSIHAYITKQLWKHTSIVIYKMSVCA